MNGRGLYALALGAFAIGTTEFVPMGLLPQVAQDLHVSIPAAGFLITGYALGVALGAPLLTIAFANLPRKRALLALLGFFIAGNALAAVSQTYGLLLAARILTSLCHGTFFGMGAIVASELVPKERSASAISTMFSGLTIATVLGVPFGAYVGNRFNWHVPYALIALIGVVALIGVWRLVPDIEIPLNDIAVEVKTLTSGRVLRALLTTVLGCAGLFTLFTYIAPLLERVSGYAPYAVSGLLMLFGVGTLIGNIAGGAYADRSLPKTLIATLAGFAIVLALSTAAWPHPILAAVATFAIGLLGFAAVTPLQMNVIRVAQNAPNLASSANIAAFNVGNAFGAALGGEVITLGFPLPSIGIAAALTTIVGIALALFSLARLRRARSLTAA